MRVKTKLIRFFQESPLDPRVGSKSMGVSFVVSSETGVPKISICCTWARYEIKEGYDRYENILFQRKPNFFISDEISITGEDIRDKLSGTSEKKLVTRDGIIFHVKQRKNPNSEGTWTVSVYLENNTGYKEKATEEHRIYQPQIRVICSNGTKTEFLEQTLEPEPNSPEAKESLAYAERSSKARGHQCGAVWEEVDPGKSSDGFSEFLWPDSNFEKLPKWAKDKFAVPNIRTDYFPSYTILQPDLDDRPKFDAEKLANTWDVEEIRNNKTNGLDKIYHNYDSWIITQESELKKIKSANLKKTGEKNISLCRESLSRINEGINFICKNPRARLAFCFMNQVMSLKMQWENRDKPDFPGLQWYEFQMAFILQSLRGVAGVDEDERKICEVLWFPTGGGKTEAYLGLSIFAVAYRRLTKDAELENDGGTTIISRYTLRLLTIQQFARAIGSIVAADYLRVENWKPDTLKNFESDEIQDMYDSKRLWGLSRISIGLWIGGTITPNKFKIFDGSVYSGGITLYAEGALAPQKIGNKEKNDMKGEPAQISNCPCCNSILATTTVKKNQPVTITWLVETLKTLEELRALKDKDFDAQNLGLEVENVKFLPSQNTFSKNKKHILFTATVTVLKSDSEKADTPINNWWQQIVKQKLTDSDKDPLESTSASRPGYFFIKYGSDDYDYSIHCLDPECKLNKGIRWYETKIKNSIASVALPFQDPNDKHYSSSIPISAFTIDEQVYAKCPTFVIATADKFARLPFDQRAASIFGNVNVFHKNFGYGRRFGSKDGIYKTPLDGKDDDQKKLDESDFTKVNAFNPPNLIIQDELHLIEGPLGSMVGIYEMAVDILCSNNNHSPKYISSSATIKESATQVGSIYRRDINVFPQPGLSFNDTYFSKIDDDISSVKNDPGRLYIGVSVGTGTYTLPVRIWAILLSEIYLIRKNPSRYGLVESFEKQKEILKNHGIDTLEKFVERETDPYWTLVGFFSDLELLARTSNFYLDDIHGNVKSMSSLSISNIKTKGLGEKKNRGIRFYKFDISENFSPASVSIYCREDGQKISVGIFEDDDGKPGKIWHEIEKDTLIKTCNKGENSFLLLNNVDKPYRILGKNTRLWVAVMNDSECYFETGTDVIDCFFSTSLKQTLKQGKMVDELGDFSTSTSSLEQIKEFPIRITLKSEFRELDDNTKIEMSSQTDSTELPNFLERLEKYPNKIDALLTTPIFGTGIDITRLGLMVVMNQPKTTSQYIQATGRVGRSGPGLVLAWLKPGRFRDLNHYENFVGFHRMIHRYVEPITASPFSQKTMTQYLGPIIVAALRNGRVFNSTPIPHDWIPRKNADFILQNTNSVEIDQLRMLMKNLATSTKIPEIRRLDGNFFDDYFSRAIKKWESTAKKTNKNKTKLAYYDYSFMHSKKVKDDIVLGTESHKVQKKKIAFENTRTSLREVESLTGFGDTL